MARNLAIINLDRQDLRIGNTVVPAAAANGAGAATVVDLTNGKVRRDLRTYYDRYAVVGTDGGASAGLNATIAFGAENTNVITATVAVAGVSGQTGVTVWRGTSASDPAFGAALSTGFGAATTGVQTSPVGTIAATYLTSKTGDLVFPITETGTGARYIWASVAGGAPKYLGVATFA